MVFRLRSLYLPGWLLGTWFVVVGALIVGGAWSWTEYQLRSEASHQQHHMADTFSAYVDGRLEVMHRLAKAVALDRRLVDLLKTPDDPGRLRQAAAFLRDFTTTAGALDAFLLDHAGRVIAAAGTPSSPRSVGDHYANLPYFRKALVGGHANAVADGESSGKAEISMATGVDADGARGVAVVVFDVDTISGFDLLDGMQDGVLMLIDADGVIFSSSEPVLRHRTFGPADARLEYASRKRYPHATIQSIPVMERESHDEAELITLAERLPSLDALHIHAGEHAHPERQGEHGAHADQRTERRQVEAPAEAEEDGHGHRLVMSTAPVSGIGWTTATLVPIPERWPVLLTSLTFALPIYGVVVFATLFVVQRSRYLRELYDKAIRDPLTSLYTRLYMHESVNAMIEACKRSNLQGMSLILLDLDHFKRINDTHGHAVGDEVLRRVGQILLEQSRPTDVPVRLGGEELAIFLPAPPHKAGVTTCAERICACIRELAVPTPAGEIRVTVSAGVTHWRPGDDLARMIEHADQAMYAAKEAGRDRIVHADQLQYLRGELMAT